MENQPEQQSAPAQIQIGLGAQYIKDFSFESPNAPHIFNDLQNQPKMQLDVNVMSRGLGGGTFEAVLKIKLESKIEEKTAFIAELAYAGLFSMPEMPEEQIKMFLLVEAPRLLYPYARAVISNAVREGGFPHIAMQPIDFMALYAAQKDNVGTMTPSGVA
ncbi:MAG: protein-export chaperone SecB [Alphaproteobacteria bacterium]|nr:protein-export chaperone SecB [Alphaproteobacteria bacterium]